MSIKTAILILFLSGLHFGMTHKSNEAVYEIIVAYKPATIKIILDTSIVTTSTISYSQTITYTDLKEGVYKVEVTGQNQKTLERDSIFVKENNKLILSFKLEGPCLFSYPKNYMPTCPHGHRDSIIPIVYGLVVGNGNTFYKNKAEMKIKYAGCVVTGCDPQFYCKTHNIDF
jgi:hypothetical protein